MAAGTDCPTTSAPRPRLGLQSPSDTLACVSDNLRTRLQKLLVTPEPPELGPGPRSGVRAQPELDAELEAILRETRLAENSRELIRSLVLLWHDHLDASHTISQGIESPDGSLLHAIMHRREPDYWNSKYWWRLVGKHPCLAGLGKRVASFLELHGERELCSKLVPHGAWDAFAFVDACEAAAGQAATATKVHRLREIQRLETEAALDFFLRDEAR